MSYKGHMHNVFPDYSDGRTKQSFKSECDINAILAKYQKTGTITHLNKHEAFYGTQPSLDLLEAHNAIQRARDVFTDLPSNVRKEFGNDLTKYLAFMNDPANLANIAEKLPELAKPGKQLPNVINKPPTMAKEAISTPQSGPAPTSTEEPA